MWLSFVEETNQAWFSLEPLTLLYPYQKVQQKVAKAFTPYVNIVKRYSKSTKRPVQPLTEEYLEEQPKVAEQNVALLKNAIELWRTATKTSDAIAPILSHYSWHCFNSFFIYSFFKWEPLHTKSHGVNITLSDDLEKIKIKILKRGLFQRLVDAWAMIGIPLAFSPFLPVVKNDQVRFVSNDKYLLSQHNELSLEQLMKFDPAEFEIALNSDRVDELVRCHFLANSVYLPNLFLRSYLVLFVASSIARYRPILWHSILTGKGEEESDFALDSSKAALDYTLGEKGDLGFVSQVTRIFNSIEQGTFFLEKSDGKPIHSSCIEKLEKKE